MFVVVPHERAVRLPGLSGQFGGRRSGGTETTGSAVDRTSQNRSRQSSPTDANMYARSGFGFRSRTGCPPCALSTVKHCLYGQTHSGGVPVKNCALLLY